MTETMEQATDTPAPLRLERRDDGIARVWIDCPGQSQNTLGGDAVNAAGHILDEIAADGGLRGLIFISAKPGSFIAGADIGMIRACESAEEATAVSHTAQRVFDRLAGLRVPVVAAIDGVCLGGGLELAMACDARICTDAGHTRLGLPEVQLGLLPGGGGTQRLPRLVGLPLALDMMLTGRQVSARSAARSGLVDEAVPADILEDVAVERIEALHAGRGRRRAGWRARLLHAVQARNPLGRAVVCSRAQESVRRRTHGNYPAPPRIIECVRTGLARGMAEGLAAEASAFGELAMTPEAGELAGIHFATTAMKKDTGAEGEPRTVERTAVLGAGLMGAGIAFVTASRARLPVRLYDVSTEGLARGLRHVHEEVRRRRGRLSAYEAGQVGRRVTATPALTGFGGVGLVVEAVPEELAIKHRTVEAVEAVTPPETIIASNTSSLPIARIAEAAQRPGNVIGMHYFSPVERMPLLEVIPHAGTDAAVVATAVAVGRAQGKTPVVVGDTPGFYVNRILAPYINEAIHLVTEGVAIHHVDGALVRFGFPVGPFKLLDEVGLDVSAHVATVLHEAYGERMRPTDAAQRMIDDGRLGRKSGRGFYRYGGRRSGSEVDEDVYELLGVHRQRLAGDDEIVQRTVGMLLNEAVRCLDEGVLRNARDGDIAAVYGIGFPPFRGGPFRYIDSLGAGGVHWWLERYRPHGARFEPAPGLEGRASRQRPFHAA
ncbi:fatty acid oxidation complex subunit alpha FadJ [Arhodomonas sp. KWT2]|uniref:fatty acid oxidation complex subunit alpha FadJ n=4 Tax=unclassified Arhodomonas TaxID=2621637 RepID=UPI0035C0A730